jgi:hypothetical protein
MRRTCGRSTTSIMENAPSLREAYLKGSAADQAAATMETALTVARNAVLIFREIKTCAHGVTVPNGTHKNCQRCC